jgi:hypothetical protein
MCTHGAMALPSDILGQPNASAALVRAVVGFMRNLCADDMRKENLGTSRHFETHIKEIQRKLTFLIFFTQSTVFDGSMALMVAAMSEKRFFEVQCCYSLWLISL